MLKTSTQKTINGYSVIDGEMAASMTASVCEDGNLSIAKNISNIDTYRKNKDEVRADMEQFETTVFSEEV